VVVAVAGCGGSSTSATSTTVASSPSVTGGAGLPALAPPRPVVWSRCPGGGSLQCGTVSVPVDYRHPGAGTIRLAVSRSPATDPTGTPGMLVFNPGGPGQSGDELLSLAVKLVPPAISRQFDIVSFDPRGTGASDPLRCGTSPSATTSLEPLPPAPGQPLPSTGFFTAMAKACRTEAGSTVPFVDTVDTARDVDRLRQALGVSQISFYGISYGTVLGAVYADLFPHRVATMVLDGAVDVNASLVVQAEQEAPAAEQSLLHLFAMCEQMAPCPLGTDPQRFFTTLAVSLTDHPLPAPGHGDTAPVTAGDLDTATLFALSVPQFVPSYYPALVDAAHGNGAPLRTLALAFDTDTDGAPLVDPLWAITCNDAASHPGPVAAGTLARTLADRYPLMGAYAVTYTMAGCVSWPKGRQPVADLHPTGTPPILVIGNTGDPNTPHIGAVHLAAIFPSATVATWRGWGHTWLLSGSSDACMQRVVTTYLTGHGLPPAGTVCN
jgi:pimeloyl-ACP methyl ester carboxylesterase